MDAALSPPARIRRPLLVVALAPVLPHIVGSVFNIWYNSVVIDPLLVAGGLKQRFIATIIVWNLVAYPIAVAIWMRLILSLRPAYEQLWRGEKISPDELDAVRRRLVHLPWSGAAISATAWLFGSIVFLGSLATTGRPMNPLFYWHFPISFGISGFIATTQGFFVIEWASQWGLFPLFFRDARPDRLRGIRPISLRVRGLMWAISASVCPIGSLLLLIYAPADGESTSQWFGFFVGGIGIVFALLSALLIGRSVAQPVDQLRVAAEAVTEGRLDVQVPLRRADEFGALIGQFNRMVVELREKERLRQTFGAHVGRKAAAEILARDPGLGGTEQVITVMFVDIRSFTARSADLAPNEAVRLLNEFLRAMVEVVEGENGGMINKFLGDGFMALFGIGADSHNHADRAVATARAMQRQLERLNVERQRRGEDALAIGIGINSGPAIVGSIGSPERMEFTVIGNTVNVASRIEALNKTLNTSLLFSKTTLDLLQDRQGVSALPPQPVKGVDEPVEVFTLAS
jgi:adenylate cyclase